MGSTNPEVVLDIFDRALQTPPEQRDRFIAEACAGNDDLRAEVASLLAHDRSAAASFMQPETGLTLQPGELLANFSQLAESQDVIDADAPDPLVGQRFGRYTIRRVIGHGGMGVVYEADQDRPHRTVALKVMRSVFASPAALRRFEREAELLGRLQHPGIAQVYEADTATFAGARIPFFALELVRDARPITDYAAAAELSLRARLELFLQVCDAVQHGHQNGVIHRDLKPANILVGTDDAFSRAPQGSANLPGPAAADLPAEPPVTDAQRAPPALRLNVGAAQPKIIDFGVARVLDPETTLATTHAGAGQLVGTVYYMSPEQFEGDPARVDTRSDVYSLGVVLYELLTGRRPHVVTDSSMAGATAFARLVRDEPPPPPSGLNRQIRRSLEAVLLKALSRNPAERYSSAGDLARDLRRYLSGEPTEAQPPTIAARVVRWMVRHPVVVTAAMCGVVAVAIVGGTMARLRYLQDLPGFLTPVRSLEEWRVFVYSNVGKQLRAFYRSSKGDLPIVVRVERPARWGGGSLLVGCDEPPRFGIDNWGIPLTAWGWAGACDQVAWTRQLNATDVPESWQQRTDAAFTPNRFAVSSVLIADVFATALDPRCEGREIITWHQHERTHAAVRIYNLRGDELYHAWLEFCIDDLYWVPADDGGSDPRDASLLLVCGVHGRRPIWQITGENSNRHPTAIVAISPQLDVHTRDYIEPDAAAPLRPVWMRFVNATVGKRPDRAWLRTPPIEECPPDAVAVLVLEFPAAEGFDETFQAGFLNRHGTMVGYVLPGTNQQSRLRLPDDHPAKIFPADNYTLDEVVMPARRATTVSTSAPTSDVTSGGASLRP